MSRRDTRPEAAAISEEIVSIRTRLNEVQEGLDSVPETAVEATRALQQRNHYLHERLAELQYILTEYSQSKIGPDDLKTADRSLIPPF